MSLHPEILALIEAGPQQVAIGKDGIGVESYAMFARRIALRQQELEREAMRAAFIDVLVETDATWSVGEARNVAEEAIRRRGKP